MNILITEKQFKFLRESIEAQTPSEQEFVKEIKNFLHWILSGIDLPMSNFWKHNGLTHSEIINKLKRFGIIDNVIDQNNFKVPKKNFDRKVSRLYYDLFPEQEELITEDGEGMTMGGDGGTVTAGSAGGSFEVPLTLSPIKRTIPSFVRK